MRLDLAACAAAIVFACAAHAASAPDVNTFEQVLEKRLLHLTPQGASERQVVFQQVSAGKPDGGYYPFVATVLVRDYEPGYPPNNYYGRTCIGRFEGETFTLLDDGAGAWMVQGRMTPPVNDCKDNPGAGISAVPLDTLPGTQAAKLAAIVPPPAGATALYLGEYACYGVGTRLMAGMGFKLQPEGRYVDIDGNRGGAYVYDAASATIGFSGGFLDGQTGSNVTNRGFDISATVNCEPWR